MGLTTTDLRSFKKITSRATRKRQLLKCITPRASDHASAISHGGGGPIKALITKGKKIIRRIGYVEGLLREPSSSF